MILPGNESSRKTTSVRPTRPKLGGSSIRRETTAARSLKEKFAFLCDARKLDILTPPWAGFSILTPEPTEMRQGALIDCRTRVHGMPIRQRTEIIEWDPPHRFVDLQLRGPYRWWHHEHRVERCGEKSRIIDKVECRAPFHWISHPLFVQRDVQQIFDYPAQALARTTGVTSAGRGNAASLVPCVAPSTNPD